MSIDNFIGYLLFIGMAVVFIVAFYAIGFGLWGILMYRDRMAMAESIIGILIIVLALVLLMTGAFWVFR